MSARRWITDWRGTPDLTKKADFYSIGPYLDARPVVAGVNARILVSTAPTVLVQPDGTPGTKPYNLAVVSSAIRHGATTPRVVWKDSGSGWHTLLVDFTNRAFLLDWLNLTLNHFVWADGFHLDYFTTFSWLFPEMAGEDPAWNEALARAASWLRNHRKLVVGQQFHLSTPLYETNGPFVEQSPFAFQYTMERHSIDAQAFKLKVGTREVVWVQEVRNPEWYDSTTLEAIEAWAEGNDMILALGRDATAQGFT